MRMPIIVGIGLLAPVLLGAQSARGGDGYLFRRPTGTFSLRAGATRPNATGGIFDFASGLLTLSPSRYAGFSAAGEASVALGQQAELVFGISVNRRKVPSEYRDWTDNRDRPIEQSTNLDRLPISMGLKWNLRPTGRSLGRLAWVPNRLVPYVAAGGGAMQWRFRQEGDFVDFQSPAREVFRSTLQDRGWAALGYAATGVAWNVRPDLAVTGEARYDISRAPLRGDFDGFQHIGLSGVGLTAGLMFRY
jgi:hypothetical protein